MFSAGGGPSCETRLHGRRSTTLWTTVPNRVGSSLSRSSSASGAGSRGKSFAKPRKKASARSMAETLNSGSSRFDDDRPHQRG